MSQKRGSWNTADTQPMKRVRLEDTRPMKAIKMESTFHWLLRCLLGLGLIVALVLLVLFIVVPDSMPKITIFTDLATTLSTGPSDSEALQILQEKHGRYWSDIQVVGKNQCPLSAQSKANGQTDAFVVFYNYKVDGHPLSASLVFFKTQFDQSWQTDDWYFQCK